MAGFLIGGRLVAGDGLDAGEITLRQIIPASSSIELPMNDYGTIDASVIAPMVDPITKAIIDLAQILVPGRDFIGWVEDDVIVEAGPIWADPFGFPHTGRLVGNGMWSYFDRRFVLPELEPGQLPRDVTSQWSGLSLGTIGKRLVQQAMLHPSAGLPIDFLPDVAGDHEREYPGSDLKTVGDALRDLTAVEGGPEITFRPKWGGDRRHVRWDFLAGNPELSQEGDDHYWDVSVPNAHASVVSLDRDGSELISRDFHVGATIRNEWNDGSFEDGLAGMGTGTNNAGITHANSNPFHGASYAAWNSGATGISYLSATRTVAVKVGEVKTFSAFTRSSASRPMGCMIRFKNKDGVILADVVGTTVTTTSTTWTRAHVTATAPANSASYDIHVFGEASAGGQVFAADAMMVTAGAELHPYAPESIQVQTIAEWSALTDAGFPLLEGSTTRGSVVLSSTLQAYSNESVLRGSAHIESFEFTTRRDKFPKLGTYWPGDYAKVRIGKNARMPADTYRVRIMTISFERNGDVTIMCAPERVASGYPVPSTKRTWIRDRLRDLSKRIAETTRGT